MAKRCWFIIYALILTSIFFFCCARKDKHPVYEKANIKIHSVDLISDELFFFNDAAVYGEIIYALNRFDVWKLDLAKQTAEKIIKNGQGPDEIFYPRKCCIYNDNCWVSSLYPNRNLFRFNVNNERIEIETTRLPKQAVFDDFIVLSDKLIACVYVYWEDALLKIIDLKKGIIKKCGKPIYSEIMMRFNVNAASISSYNGNIYVIQNIAPIVEVFSIQECKKIYTITLNPPFYKKMPGKYNVDINSKDAHRNWMSSWTTLFNIMIDKGWILVQYKRGYDFVFYYELVNINDINRRYYIAETGEFIYDFKVLNNSFYIMTGEFKDEICLWKKGEIMK